MIHRIRLVAPLAVLLACGGDLPQQASPSSAAPVVSPSAPRTAQAAAAPAPSSTLAPTEPTTLTEAQKQRDAARAALATAVVGAYPNWNGFFSTLIANYSPDGKRILFGSLRDGVPEIYEGEVAKPGAAPRVVTAGPERAIWARYTVDGGSIVFLRDVKGDENHHIWRVKPDGTGATDLTPGEALHRGEPLLPPKRPDMMIYTASRTSSPAVMVYTQSLAGGEPKLVYTNPRPGSLDEPTSDGSRVLFADVPSGDENVVFEIETATGKTRRIYPPEGKKAAVFASAYSPDDARIYIATDEGAESSVVLTLDSKTGRELARYASRAPAAAPIEVVVAPRGNRLALRVNAGNHGEVRILDAATMKLERVVKVPLGDVHVGSFREDGKEFSLLVSLPDKPADVYAADAATGAVRPLRDDKRTGVDSLPAIDATIEDVKAFDGLTIPINRYLPRAAAKPPASSPPAAKLPTIAMFHGGPASSSAVRWNPFARFFVALGYAVIEPNVRGSAGFGRAYEQADNRERRADWLKDVETVNTWAKSQPWCDPDRVVVWGQSYGGYTTLMALTRQPTAWRAGVDLYGVTDLKRFLSTTDAAIRSVFVSEFGDVDKDGPLLDRFSPLRDVGAIVAPLFVYTGQNDPRVPRSEADAIVRALRARNVPVEYMVAPDEGHTVDRNANKVELLTRTARFIEDATKAPPPR